MDRIPTKNQPKLFEAVIQEMQVALGNELAWLNHVFGKAEKTKQDYRQHKGYVSPSVYVGGGKYERIVPDQNDWGNYAFFYMEEPQDIDEQMLTMPYFRMSGTVSLIVWGDSRDIEAEDDRNLESIKADILQVLGGMTISKGHVEWNRVYEQDKGVFEEYSCSEEDGQYMMWPYFAFRFEGRVTCNSGCVVS